AERLDQDRSFLVAYDDRLPASVIRIRDGDQIVVRLGFELVGGNWGILEFRTLTVNPLLNVLAEQNDPFRRQLPPVRVGFDQWNSRHCCSPYVRTQFIPCSLLVLPFANVIPIP